MKQKAIISGSHGFIGLHLIKKLTSINFDIIPLDRIDLHLPFTLTKLLRETNPDYIFHLGAYGNMHHQKDEQKIFRANLEGIFTLLSASKDINYKGFINMSTSSVGLSHETLYSATKAGGERLVKAFVNEYNKPIVNFRPYSVYGEDEADYRFIPTVFRSCLTGEPMELASEAKHDWVYVDDVVTSLIDTAMRAEEYKGNVIECGTGVGTLNWQVVDMIQHITGEKANIESEMFPRPYDSPNWYADYPDSNKMQLYKGLEKIYPHFKERYSL